MCECEKAKAKLKECANKNAAPTITAEHLHKLAAELKDLIVVASADNIESWEPVLLRGFTNKKSQSADKKNHPDDKEIDSSDSAEIKEMATKYFANMGLGRGIDVTRRQPFAEKTTTQVMPVEFDELLGSDEGGHMHQFTEFAQEGVNFGAAIGGSIEITPQSIHAPAVVLPQSLKVNVSVSQEVSRTMLNSTVVLGMRIVNRSVGFQETIDKLPHHNELTTIITDLYSAYGSHGEGIVESELDSKVKAFFSNPLIKALVEPKDAAQSTSDFEANLTDWVIRYMNQVRKLNSGESKECKVIEDLKELQSPKEESELLDACDSFTRSTGVTHYVSSIQLGAELYKSITHQNYTKLLETNISAEILGFVKVGNVDGDGDGEASSSLLHWSESKILTHTAERELGKVTVTTEPVVAGGKIVRKFLHVSPKNEAVVGYQLKPVASILMNRTLAKCMAEVARDYIADKSAEIIGPFHLAAHDIASGRTVYLKKKADSDQIEATLDRNEADGFKILPASHSEEFHIVYEATDTVDKKDGKRPEPFPYYLTTHHTFLGYSKETPTLEQHPKESNAVFAFHNQLGRVINWKSDMEEGLLNGETMLINCEGRRLATDGYLALERKPWPDTDAANLLMNPPPPSTNFQPVCTRYCSSDDTYLLAFRMLRIRSPQRNVDVKPAPPPMQGKLGASSTTPPTLAAKEEPEQK